MIAVVLGIVLGVEPTPGAPVDDGVAPSTDDAPDTDDDDELGSDDDEVPERAGSDESEAESDGDPHEVEEDRQGRGEEEPVSGRSEGEASTASGPTEGDDAGRGDGGDDGETSPRDDDDEDEDEDDDDDEDEDDDRDDQDDLDDQDYKDEDEDDSDGKDKNGKDKNGKDKKGKGSFAVRGRLMAGWKLDNRRPSPEQDATPGVEHELFLQQARVKLDVDYTKRFRLRASIELSDALDAPRIDRVPFLRNGYADVRFHNAARLRVGNFKRPFSRLELRSTGRLPFRGRGLTNDRLLEDRNYGDRSVGGMLHGKIPAARLRYAAGVFVPALRTQGIDVVGRVRADPWEWLSVGGGGVYKRVENGVGEKVDVGGVGADLRVKIKGFYILGDLVAARDYLVPGEPWSLGVVGYATYDIDLPKKLVLQPVLFGEWSDIDLSVSQNDAVRVVAGFNLIWRKRFRVMPQARFVRPQGVTGNPWVDRETYYVMLSLQI
ncbi:MAG: porin [Myxococcota bacterium]